MKEFKTSNNHDDKVVSQPISDFHIEEDEHFSYNDYKIEDWLAFILFWLLAFTVFSQFISRYLLSAPLGWTEEIARYQLVCLGFIGACIGIRKNTHIYVALFHRWLPTKLSHTIYTFIAVFNVVFIAYLAFFAWQILPKLHIHKMASISVSISVIYGIIFASLLIMLLRSGQYLGTILTKTENLSNQKTTNKLN
jgi:TRAP-type C4-dicarboxylate transport system permease small subunit